MVQKTRGNGAYAPLGTGYYRDDAILEAGEKAELLFVRGLAYCAETPSDGFITHRQLRAVVGIGMRDVLSRAETLVSVGLWEQVDGGFSVRSWLKWNKSAEEIGRHKARDRERKAQNPGDVQGDSTRNPDGTPTDSRFHYTTQHYTTQHEGESADAPRGGGAEVVAIDQVETVNQRANRLAKTYTDVVALSNFPAVAGVVRKAIQARKSDDEITSALSRLAADGRSVTTETLRIEIEGLTRRSPTMVKSRDQQATDDLFAGASERMLKGKP